MKERGEEEDILKMIDEEREGGGVIMEGIV